MKFWWAGAAEMCSQYDYMSLFMFSQGLNCLLNVCIVVSLKSKQY